MSAWAPVAACVPLSLFLALAGARAGEPGVFAAVGLSKNADVMAAATEATQALLEKFKAAGRKPGAVIFVERVEKVPNAKGKAIGDKVKELAGVPTFGHGAVGNYGLALAPDVKDKDNTFLVLGLAAPGLDVKGYAAGGSIAYSYPPPNAPEDVKAREKDQRAACKARGKDLGERIPKLEKPGFVLVLGALHNNWHTTFCEGLREALGESALLMGGVGKWDDYVYNDGQPCQTKDGKPTAVGQLAVVIQGDLRAALAGSLCPNVYQLATVQETIEGVLGKLMANLGGKRPAVLFAFSCVTLLRDSKAMDPAALYPSVAKVMGEGVPVWGCFCGGELGVNNDGSFSATGNRFMAAALADK